MVNIIGSNAATLGGASEKLLVTNDSNITSSMVGGGGAAGTQTISVVPWATYENNSLAASLNNPARMYRASGGLVTYTSAGGFRVLASNEYANNLTSGATSNVELTASTTAATTGTINALFLNGSAASQIFSVNSGVTITVASGEIINEPVLPPGTILSPDLPARNDFLRLEHRLSLFHRQYQPGPGRHQHRRGRGFRQRPGHQYAE